MRLGGSTLAYHTPWLLIPCLLVVIDRCGKRGGYVELRGFEKAVKDELYKLASISLCSNVAGQVMVGCAPPCRPGVVCGLAYDLPG